MRKPQRPRHAAGRDSLPHHLHSSAEQSDGSSFAVHGDAARRRSLLSSGSSRQGSRAAGGRCAGGKADANDVRRLNDHRGKTRNRSVRFRPTVQLDDISARIPSAWDTRAESPEQKVLNIDQRLREKRSYRRGVLLKKTGIAVGVLLVLAVLAWLLFFSSVFRFSSHKAVISGAEGNSLIKNEDVQAVLEKYDDTALILLRTSSVEQSLKEIPEVKDAQVSLRFPQGLNVTLVQQEPFICWGSLGKCVVLAEDGSPLRTPPQQHYDLPVLAVEGDKAKPENFMQVISDVYGQLDPSLQQQIASMVLSESRQVSFTLESGSEILWGTAQDAEMKRHVLSVLLKEGRGYYDVSNPASPVTK